MNNLADPGFLLYSLGCGAPHCSPSGCLPGSDLWRLSLSSQGVETFPFSQLPPPGAGPLPVPSFFFFFFHPTQLPRVFLTLLFKSEVFCQCLIDVFCSSENHATCLWEESSTTYSSTILIPSHRKSLHLCVNLLFCLESFILKSECLVLWTEKWKGLVYFMKSLNQLQ